MTRNLSTSHTCAGHHRRDVFLPYNTLHKRAVHHANRTCTHHTNCSATYVSVILINALANWYQ